MPPASSLRLLAVVLFLLPAAGRAAETRVPGMNWQRLPSLPDAEGFAAPFAGVSGGALLVAGGANIPGEKWREPFVKVWHDRIFVLPEPGGRWQQPARLPHPLGYGVSITYDDAVFCFGGSDRERHYDTALALRWQNGAIKIEPLPRLPRPCANACGAIVGDTVYLAGGLESPTATTALHSFWACDLSAPMPIWRELDPWPGPSRMLAVAGVLGDAFYLFSGTKLSAGAGGQPVREYLRDAYRYTPARGWQRLADLPRAAVAAPSPALVLGGRLAIPSGDDGLNTTFQPVQEHPGFPRTTLLHDPKADVWSVAESLPFSLATVPTVQWGSRWVIPNGEARPRVRTPEVWALEEAPAR
jgi:N-acetylneuraminic acid mutarotase